MKNDKSHIKNDKERALVEITNGTRTPKTEFEKKLAAEIKKLKARGIMIEIPSDI